MIKASIDIGSNSTLLLIAKIEGEKIIEVLEEEQRITKLGRDLDKNKKFHQESMDDTFSALREYRSLIDRHNVQDENIIMTGTEASRVATNGCKFYAKVESELRFKLRLLSGEEEAFYTSSGLTKGLEQAEGNITIVDIGGASTELISVQLSPFKILFSTSLPMGAERMRSLGLEEAKKEIFRLLQSVDVEKFNPQVIGVAGTCTTLSAMSLRQIEFEATSINKSSIGQEMITKMAADLLEMSAEEILDRYPITGKRSVNIGYGALILDKVLNKLNADKLSFSTYGLRHGTLFISESL